MNAKIPSTPASEPNSAEQSSDPGLNQIGQNIETISGFYTREAKKLTGSQRALETASGVIGRPLFVGCILIFVVLWTLANVYANRLGIIQFDAPPFFWLQGMVSLGALFTTTVVLIKQSRLARLEERRAHLEMQVNLLTEQKVTKLINLLEELRRDLPMVKDRHDAEAVALQQPTDPEQVLAALDARRETAEPLIPTEEDKGKD